MDNPPDKSHKDSKLTRMIQSVKSEVINKRFIVKVSIFDNGVNKSSILVVVADLLDAGFTMKYFEKPEEAARFLDILRKV